MAESSKSKPTTTKYRFTGSHVETLSDGTTVVPGEFYELTREQLVDNQWFVDEGKMIEVPERGGD